MCAFIAFLNPTSDYFEILKEDTPTYCLAEISPFCIARVKILSCLNPSQSSNSQLFSVFDIDCGFIATVSLRQLRIIPEILLPKNLSALGITIQEAFLREFMIDSLVEVKPHKNWSERRFAKVGKYSIEMVMGDIKSIGIFTKVSPEFLKYELKSVDDQILVNIEDFKYYQTQDEFDLNEIEIKEASVYWARETLEMAPRLEFEQLTFSKKMKSEPIEKMKIIAEKEIDRILKIMTKSGIENRLSTRNSPIERKKHVSG